MARKCKCQDSAGKVCGKVMTNQEFKQDGMCWNCADNVWAEMQAKEGEYVWTHPKEVTFG